MDENKKNIDFLNDKRTPTVDMIYAAFSINFPDDIEIENVDFSSDIDMEWNELGEPHSSDTLEGTEWMVRKLTWNTPKGLVVKFEIRSMNMDENIIDIEYEDLDDEDSEDDFILTYDERLWEALEHEDYREASRLRDWKLDLDALNGKLKPLMVKALEDEDYLKLNEYLMAIKNYYKTI